MVKVRLPKAMYFIFKDLYSWQEEDGHIHARKSVNQDGPNQMEDRTIL